MYTATLTRPMMVLTRPRQTPSLVPYIQDDIGVLRQANAHEISDEMFLLSRSTLQKSPSVFTSL